MKFRTFSTCILWIKQVILNRASLGNCGGSPEWWMLQVNTNWITSECILLPFAMSQAIKKSSGLLLWFKHDFKNNSLFSFSFILPVVSAQMPSLFYFFLLSHHWLFLHEVENLLIEIEWGQQFSRVGRNSSIPGYKDFLVPWAGVHSPCYNAHVNGPYGMFLRG